jgi:hypothetical protein
MTNHDLYSSRLLRPLCAFAFYFPGAACAAGSDVVAGAGFNGSIAIKTSGTHAIVTSRTNFLPTRLFASVALLCVP